MEKRKRAPVEDGKGKIKKIQAAKEALGVDHLAKDKILNIHSLHIRCDERNNTSIHLRYLRKIFLKFILSIHKNPRNKQQLHPPFYQLYMKFHIYLI